MSLAEAINSHVKYAYGKIDSWSFTKEYVDRPDVPSEVLAKFDGGSTHVNAPESNVSFYQRDDDGRILRWVDKRGVICPNLDKWPEEVPKKSDKKYGPVVLQGHWIKQSACRRCEFYRTRNQSGLKYPTCAWAQDNRCGDESPERVGRRNLQKSIKEAFESIA